MALRWESKRPAEVRTYQIAWENFLGSDTIDSYTLTPIGVDIDSDSLDMDERGITVTLSGGDTGTLAQITNEIVTATGQTEVEKIVLYISDFSEPISLAEIKRQVRMVEDDSQDDYLCDLVAPARAYCERRSHGHVFVRRRFSDSFSRWGDYLEVWRRPIIVDDDNPITVTYTDAAGSEVDYEGFLGPVGRYPLRISPSVNGEFPTLVTGSSVSVSYTAGYDEGSHDEAMIIGKRAMLLLIGHWFENRESVVVGQASSEVELAVSALLDELRPVSAY